MTEVKHLLESRLLDDGIVYWPNPYQDWSMFICLFIVCLCLGLDFEEHALQRIGGYEGGGVGHLR